ncbi:ABC transporter permease [Actinoplanes couchii]|uniref:ABC transporter permease n=1 Tax=Actinoplanes couchii TaxID=403638 RepID=A0ABQ3XTL1_9ACTN|nr:ABC transporter permease [Actinoplanes couchii]MDR6318955.1 putative ABC transport system permease protein [Actinoplanes couchii]GID61803.1 ABC transporter permease [Actinoplanes couchii]
MRLGEKAADLIGLGLFGIRTRKVRAVLSALGIAIGIATLVLVTGIPASSQRALDRKLAALGTNRLQVTPAPNHDPPLKLPVESADMVARIGPVTRASAIGDFGLDVARSDRTADGDFNAIAVVAARTDLLPAIDGRLRHGRFLDAAMQRLPTVVLGAVAAQRLGFTGVDLTRPSQVYVGRQRFTVIGILDPVALSPEIDRSALVGWDAAARWLRFDGHPTRIYVQTTDAQVAAVRAVLAATANPERPGDVLVSRPSDALAAKQAVTETFHSLLLGLAGIALLVGGVGVANTMYISVLERRREIGLRRALGANRGQIRTQFVTESIVLSMLGGTAGVLTGALAVAGYAVFQDWPVTVPPVAAGAGLAGALVIGVLAGAYPAVRAARLDPTEALSSV